MTLKERLFDLIERTPDAVFTHLMAFLGGLVSALLIATMIALF